MDRRCAIPSVSAGKCGRLPPRMRIGPRTDLGTTDARRVSPSFWCCLPLAQASGSFNRERSIPTLFCRCSVAIRARFPARTALYAARCVVRHRGSPELWRRPHAVQREPGPRVDAGVASLLRLQTLARSGTSLYWAIVFLLMAPALGVMLWRTREAPEAERRRVFFFLAALVAGLLPLLLIVGLELASDAFDALTNQPRYLAVVDAIIYASIISIPFTTTYSVVVRHVIAVRIVIRKTVRYALARQTLIVLTVTAAGSGGQMDRRQSALDGRGAHERQRREDRSGFACLAGFLLVVAVVCCCSSIDGIFAAK